MKIQDLIFPIDEPYELASYLRNKSNNYTEYVRVWQVYCGEALRRTFAYKTSKGKQYVTEVMREIVSDDSGCINKNCYYNMYCGYTAVYNPPKIRSTWYSYNVFDTEDYEKWYFGKPLGMSCVADLGQEKILKLDKYEHCGYSVGNLLEYLRLYEKNPAIEYFGKLGIYPMPSYVKLAKKDKQFIRFLKDNILEIKEKNPEVVLYAYRHHTSIGEAGNIIAKKRNALSATIHISALKGLGIDRVKVYEYMCKNGISSYLYDDYLHALKELELDLNDTKNLLPNDFKRMHDIRIDEAKSKRVIKKAEERKKFEESFYKKCMGYTDLQDVGNEYQIIIPLHIIDLVNEGESLHHCVGKMGYDTKVIEGKSIIAFVRKRNDPQIPFVTVEYKPKEHKVTQCYADSDTKPSDDVLKYVAEWERKVNKILKKRTVNLLEGGVNG